MRRWRSSEIISNFYFVPVTGVGKKERRRHTVCRMENGILPSPPPNIYMLQKIEVHRGKRRTADDKKDRWKQIYNSLAKIKKKEETERKERIRRKKSSNFSSSYVSISGVIKMHM